MDVWMSGGVCLFALTAAVLDLRSGRIPNRLILAGLLLGAVMQLLRRGALGLLLWLGGASLPLLLFGALFCFRMIGAGDVKLLSVLGGFFGPIGIWDCLFLALLFGGLLALGLMLWRRNLSERFLYFAGYLVSVLAEGRWRPYRRKGDRGSEMPFALPVLVSVLCIAGGGL